MSIIIVHFCNLFQLQISLIYLYFIFHLNNYILPRLATKAQMYCSFLFLYRMHSISIFIILLAFKESIFVIRIDVASTQNALRTRHAKEKSILRELISHSKRIARY